MPLARTILDALAVASLSLAGAHAQTAGLPARADLPRLTRLGPLPTDAPRVSLRADGSLFDGRGAQLATATLAASMRADAQDLVVSVERTTPAAAIVALLAIARAQAVGRVHFAATLPDGTSGGFTLALPRASDPTTTVEVRAHRERPGVPPSSVTPLLQRLRAGMTTQFVLGVEVAGDTSCEQMLRVLGAVADAGVQRVSLSCALTPTQRDLSSNASDLRAVATASPVDGTAMAMDLGPFPRTQVPAAARPQAPPRLRDGLFGCFEPGQDSGPEAQPNQADGVARGPVGRAAAVENGSSWLFRQQRSDGGFGNTDDHSDLEATSLVTLMMLGEGQTVDADDRADALRRSLGWLFGQQSLDGRFGDVESGVRLHALATYAMAEAAGASPRGRLLRGSAQEALDWLCAQRRRDGGWNDGTPGAASDALSRRLAAAKAAASNMKSPSTMDLSRALSTAWCVAALAAGEHFEFRVRVASLEASAWFLSVAEPAGGDAPAAAMASAAALCSVLRTGTTAPPGAADRVLATANLDDPWSTYWATEAMYRLGGAHWNGWSRKLTAIVATQVNDGDEKGTWDPVGGESRLVTSALRVLTLQMYYRYSRLVR